MNTHNFFSILERDFEKEISKNYNIVIILIYLNIRKL